MDREEHKQRYELLHKELDELLADYIRHTGKLISNSTLLELMEWSFKQTENPTELTKQD